MVQVVVRYTSRLLSLPFVRGISQGNTLNVYSISRLQSQLYSISRLHSQLYSISRLQSQLYSISIVAVPTV